MVLKTIGGYIKGAGAQEENLYRRTNFFQIVDDPYQQWNSFRNWNYPLPEFGGLYIPNAYVFRKSELNGYAFLEKPEFMSFVAVYGN